MSPLDFMVWTVYNPLVGLVTLTVLVVCGLAGMWSVSIMLSWVSQRCPLLTRNSKT